MVSGALETAQQQAREAAETAQQQAAAVAARAQQQAREAAATCASYDISKMELGSMSELRDSATKSVSALGSTVTSVAKGAGEWAASPMAPGRTTAGAEAAGGSKLEESSDSGGEDPTWGGRAPSLGGLASCFGLSAARSPEKQGLIPKGGSECGGSDGGGGSSSFSGLGGGSAWDAMNKVRDMGMASASYFLPRLLTSYFLLLTSYSRCATWAWPLRAP